MFKVAPEMHEMYKIDKIIYNGQNDPYMPNSLLFGTAKSKDALYCMNHCSVHTMNRLDSQINSGLFINFRHHVLITGLYNGTHYFSYVYHKNRQVFEMVESKTSMMKCIEYGDTLHLYFLDHINSKIRYVTFRDNVGAYLPCNQADIDTIINTNIKTLLLRTLTTFDQKKVHDGNLIHNASIHLYYPPKISDGFHDIDITVVDQ